MKKWACQVLCMIAEYHMACVTRGSPVSHMADQDPLFLRRLIISFLLCRVMPILGTIRELLMSESGITGPRPGRWLYGYTGWTWPSVESQPPQHPWSWPDITEVAF